MKIRNGFVSNSSSSSYVVLLPENFMEKYNFPSEGVKNIIQNLVDSNGLWRDEFYDEYDNVYKIIRPYIIVSIDTGPDEGQIVLADREKIKKIMNE